MQDAENRLSLAQSVPQIDQMKFYSQPVVQMESSEHKPDQKPWLKQHREASLKNKLTNLYQKVQFKSRESAIQAKNQGSQYKKKYRPDMTDSAEYKQHLSMKKIHLDPMENSYSGIKPGETAATNSFGSLATILYG